MLNEIVHAFKRVDTPPVKGVVNTLPVGFSHFNFLQNYNKISHS